jgi:putative DNA primase/helicase
VNTLQAAKGRWRDILSQLGIDREFLRGPRDHGPCPLCGGHDRYRWDNKDGQGSYICNQCGAGTGMQLLQRFTGMDFREAAAAVDRVIGNANPDNVKPRDTGAERKLRRDLWMASAPMTREDGAWAYLQARRVVGEALPCNLRYAASTRAPDGVSRPAMVAVVHDANGKACTMHRTFLDGAAKAAIAKPRAMMPGDFPDGAAVRLCQHGDLLGIAEGIETALAAWTMFGVPTWAALTAGNLAKWRPPATVSRVIVFGDCDASFTGQAAAYTLANRLSVQRDPIPVEVRLPLAVGYDWADEILATALTGPQ